MQLLSEKDLTLEAALRLAQSMEAADANVTKLQNNEQPAPVNRTDASRSQQARKVCYRCGGNDHAPTACKYKEFTCNKCKKRGHLARVCRSSDRHDLPPSTRSTQQQVQPPRDTKPRNPYHKKRQHNIREPSVDELENPMYKVNKKQSSRPITVTLNVNRQKLQMEVDTGAAISVISEFTKNKLFPGVYLNETPVMLTTYTGEQMAVVGEISITVRYEQHNHCLTLCIIIGRCPCLLGRDWLYQLRLDIQSLYENSINYSQTSSTHEQLLLNQYDCVFNKKPGEISCLKPHFT